MNNVLKKNNSNISFYNTQSCRGSLVCSFIILLYTLLVFSFPAEAASVITSKPGGTNAAQDSLNYFYNGVDMTDGVGLEFRLVENKAGHQLNAAVAVLQDPPEVGEGRKYIAVYEEAGVGIRGKIINRDGESIGDEFTVTANSGSEYYNMFPKVASLPGGGFIVVWTLAKEGQVGTVWNKVYMRFFQSDGTPSGSAREVEPGTKQFDAKVAVSSEYIIVVYTVGALASADICRKQFNLDGTVYRAAVTVNNTTSGPQTSPEIAVLKDDGYVIVWDGIGNGGHSAYLARFDKQGGVVRGETSTGGGVGSNYPSIAALPNGGFVLAWAHNTTKLDNNRWIMDAYYRMYDANTNPITGITMINYDEQSSALADCLSPKVVALEDGYFVIVYERNNDLAPNRGDQDAFRELFYRVYDESGSSLMAPKKLPTNVNNTHPEFAFSFAAADAYEIYNEEDPPELLDKGESRCIMLWNSLGQDETSSWGIFGKAFVIGPGFINLDKQKTYVTLQQALNDADENNTIGVLPGTHTLSEQVVWPDKQNITVRAYHEYNSGTNSANVILEGGGGNRLFYVPSAVSMSIQNVTLKGGRAPDLGGALYCRVKGAKINIKNTKIIENSAQTHAGAFIADSGVELTIDSCYFENNSAAQYGGVLYANNDSDNNGAADGGKIIIKNSIFLNNSAVTYGGALYLEDFPNVLIENTVFYKNSTTQSAYGGGSALWAEGSNVNIKSSIFRENSVDSGSNGGAIMLNNCNLTTQECYFIKNKKGGVLKATNADWSAQNCVFRENSNFYSNSVIYHDNNTSGRTWHFDSCTFLNNPGVLFVQSNVGFYINARNSIFHGNTGGYYSGNITLLMSNSYNAVDYTGGNIGPNTVGLPKLAFDSYPFLLKDSPCVDAGDAYLAPGVDLEYNSRPRGADFDMGAYEDPYSLLYGFHPGNSYSAPNDFVIQFRVWLGEFTPTHPITVEIEDLRATATLNRSETIEINSADTAQQFAGTYFTAQVVDTEDPDRKVVILWQNPGTFQAVKGDHFLVKINGNHMAPEGYAYRFLEAVEDKDRALSYSEFEFFIAGIPYVSEWFDTGITQNNTVKFGSSIGNGADINQDGYPDLIVGDTEYQNNSGQVFLFYGGPAKIRSSVATFYSTEPNAGNEFGKKVLLANINDDDYGDIIIGEPGYNGNDGRLLIYYGSRAIYGASAIDTEHPDVIINVPDGETGLRFGERFDAGNLNRDAFGDIIIAAPSANNGNGIVYVYDGSDLSKEPVALQGIGEGFARSAAIIGDIDRDGADDIAIGVPYATVSGVVKAGKVQMCFGEGVSDLDFFDTSMFHQIGIIELTAQAPTENDLFGYSIAKGGDINHDNFSDVLVGKYTVPGKKGAAWIFFGSGTRSELGHPVNTIFLPQPKDLSVSFNYAGEPPVQQFGLTLISAGDLDGDDYDDILIGAPDATEEGHGLVYLYMGGEIIDWNFDASNFNGYVISGHDAEAHLGKQMTNLGDFNADGYEEIALNDRFINEDRVNILYNSFATDLTGPMVTKALPDNDMVGVPVGSKFQFIIYDRGKSGINLNSLEIVLYPKGMGDLKTAQKRIIIPGGIGNNKNTAMNTNLVVQGSTTLVTDTGEITYAAHTPIPCDPYKVSGKVKAVKIEFQLLNSLAYSEGYEFKFAGRDWGHVPPEYQVVEFTGNLITPNILSFSTNQDLFIQGTIGNKVKNIGDYNNDGFDDLAVYTQGEKSNGKLGELWAAHPAWFAGQALNAEYQNAGYVLLYFGGPGIQFSTPNVILVGASQADNPAGFNIYNHNRFAADVIGSQQMNIGISEAQVKFNDVIVADYYSGKVFRYPGKPIQYTVLPILLYDYYSISIMNGSAQIQRINTLAALHDINNDDYPDIAVSTGGSSDEVFIVYGQPGQSGIANAVTKLKEDNLVSGIQTGSGFGFSIAGIGDVDGDGIRDLLIGAPYHDGEILGTTYEESGAVFLVPGKAYTNINSPGVFNSSRGLGARAGAHFGYSVAGGYLDDSYAPGGALSNTGNSYVDLVIGSPNDNQFGANAGSVTIYFGKEDFDFEEAQQVGNPSNYKIKNLIPESVNSGFGTRVICAQFLSNPNHYQKWSFGQIYYAEDVPYFDDYDDVIVSAKTYDNLLASGEIDNGKAYIYRGGSDFEKPIAGYLGDKNSLMSDLINAGNVVGLGADFIGLNDSAGNIKLLRNKDIPDTVEPVFIYFKPLNNAYDVNPVPAEILFEVSDVSSISTPSLQVYRYRRDYEHDDKWIVYNGVVTDKSLDDPSKEYDLISQYTNENKTTVRFTLKPNLNYRPEEDHYPAGQWTESEPINLDIYIGDARLVWISPTKRELQPLIAKKSYGFMTKFKPNEATEYEIFGEKLPNSYFGSAMANVGDINGDGFADFIVGEYGNHAHGPYSGKAYVFLGSGDPFALSKSDLEIDLGAGTGSSRFGYKVAPAGDVNNDGFMDVAIVGLNSGSTGGEVFILYGGPGVVTDINSPKWDVDYLNTVATVIRAENSSDGFGTAVWGGDINGDGYSDLVIGAPYKTISGKVDTGRAYVILGRKFDTSYRNLNPNSTSGAHGPITFSDLVSYQTVALQNYDPESFVQTLYGFYLDGTEQYDRFGYSVLADININGDKTVVGANNPENPNATKNTDVSEFLIGAPGAEKARGKVTIYTCHKDTKNLSVLKELEGFEEGENFGYALVSLGDITNDFNLKNSVYDDFAISAPYNNESGVNAGAVYVYLGAETMLAEDPIRKLYGQNEGDLFGYALANVGNVDNDEFNNNDLAVSAIHNTFGGNYAGRVYIFGTGLDTDTNELVMSRFAQFANEGNAGHLFGYSIAGLGDVDGDFVPEYLIGAPAFAENNIENIGRVYLLTNPDIFGPEIVEAMTNPIPNSTGNAKVFSYWDDNLFVTINIPLTIRAYVKDNRAVNITATSIEVKGQDENRAYTYRFNPPQNGVAYYTIHNRKKVEFFVVHPYYRYGEWVDVTVNATDMRGNIIESNLAFNPPIIGEPYHYRFQVEENPLGGPSRIIVKVNPDLTMNGAGRYGDSKLYTNAPDRLIRLALAARDKAEGVERFNLGMGSTDILQVAGKIEIGSVPGEDGAVYAGDYDLDTAVTFNLGIDENYNVYNTNDPYAAIVELSYGDGLKEFAFQCWDRIGNPSEVVTVDVILDTAPPEVSQITPEPGSINNEDAPTISFRVEDAGTGLNLEALLVQAYTPQGLYEYYVPYGSQKVVFDELYEPCNELQAIKENFVSKFNRPDSALVSSGVLVMSNGDFLRTGSSAYTDCLVEVNLADLKTDTTSGSVLLRATFDQFSEIQTGYRVRIFKRATHNYNTLAVEKVIPGGNSIVLGSDIFNTTGDVTLRIVLNGPYCKAQLGSAEVFVRDDTYIRGNIAFKASAGVSKLFFIEDIAIKYLPQINTVIEPSVVQNVHTNGFQEYFTEFKNTSVGNIGIVIDPEDDTEVNNVLRLSNMPVSINCFTDNSPDSIPGLEADYALEFKALVPLVNTEAAVYFRVQDNENGYLLVFQGSSIRWMKMINGIVYDGTDYFKEIKNYGRNNDANEWVAYKLIVNGSHFTLYENGTLISEVYEIDTVHGLYQSGGFGFSAFGTNTLYIDALTAGNLLKNIVDANLKLPKLNYLDWVTVNIHAEDLTVADYQDHKIIEQFSFRVSPDYRAPINPAIDINDGGRFGTRNVSVALEAFDDVGITEIFVTGDVTNNAGAVTVHQWVSINYVEGATNNIVVALDPNTYGINTDGPREISIYFRDALKNESKAATDDIILFVFTTEGRPVISKFFFDATRESDQPRATSRNEIEVYLDGYDVEGSGIIVGMKLYGDLTEESAVTPDAWTLFENYKLIYLDGDADSEGQKIITARFLDRDNIETSKNISYVLDLINQINSNTVTPGALGKMSVPVTASIIYDISPPAFEVIQNIPADLFASYFYTRFGGSLKGMWSAHDDVSDIATYKYRIMERQVTKNELQEEEFVTSQIVAWTNVSEAQINRFENNAVEIISNIQLNPDTDGYFFEIRAYDLAGNSITGNTNLLGLDTKAPGSPYINYYEKIPLNRPVFDIDFPDERSGIYRVEYSLGNPNASRQKISEISSSNVITTGNYVKEYVHNWALSSEQWDAVPEGENTMYFKITDAAGNISFPGLNTNRINFVKDTVAPEGVVRFNRGAAYADVLEATCNINFNTESDFHQIYLTRWPVSVNQFLSDYSFEEAGDNDRALPAAWQLDYFNGVTAEIKLLDQTTVEYKEKEGMYGLLVSFNSTLGDLLPVPERLVIHKTIRIPTADVTYNITGYINLYGLIGMLSEGGPYFIVEAESDSGGVEQSLPLFQTPGVAPADDFGWIPFTFDIYVGSGDDFTISLKLAGDNLEGSTPFVGYCVLDSLNAIPGGFLLVTQNKVAEFGYELQAGDDGVRKIFVLANDYAGNWKSSEASIYYDTTPPTFSGTYVENGVTANNGIFCVPVQGNDPFQAVFGQIQAYWHADDYGGSGVDYYEYRIERAEADTITSMNNWEAQVQWDPYYPLPAVTSNFYLTTDTFKQYLIPMNRNRAYRFVVRAVDKLGHTSDPAISNGIIIDIDAPQSSAEVPDGLVVTLSVVPEVVTQNSGWFKDGPIPVTISAFDHSKVIEATTDMPTINGSGVSTINYITGYIIEGVSYYNPTQSISVDGQNQIVTFNLNHEGTNFFAYWSTDAVGWSEKITWVTNNLRIEKNYPSVTTNLHQYSYPVTNRWWQIESLPVEFTVDDGLRSGVEYLPGPVYRHKADRLGEGVYKLYYKVDELPSSNILLDAREIGSNTPWGVPPTINLGAITGWNSELTPYTEPFTISSEDGTLPTLQGEGIHKVFFWAEDKFGHVSSVNSVGDIRIDNGDPLLSVNMGGSFQVQWCTNPNGVIAILEAKDVYSEPVSLNINWFTFDERAQKPSGYTWGEKYTIPGSGTKYLWYQINDQLSVTIDADPIDNRFVMKPPMSGMTVQITRNGYNVFKYKLEDNAENRTSIFFDTPVWDRELKSWVTAADQGVVRFIKIDTEPPYDGEMYLDKYDEDPLYTNSRLVSCNLIAKDKGKGVMYAYLTGYDVSSNNDALVNSANFLLTPPGFMVVNTWNHIIADQDADYNWDVESNKGPRSVVNIIKWMFLADEDGTKNVQVVYADDFALPYEAPSANEQTQWLFYQNNRDNVSANGEYPVFSEDEKARLDTIPFPDWPTRSVYTVLYPAVPNHKGATANAIIVLDRKVNPGVAWVKNEFIPGVVGTQNVQISVLHTDPQYIELSGIKYFRAVGSPQDIIANGQNNIWHRWSPGITNNLTIRVTELNATKSIYVEFKDRAGNIGGRVTINVYYENMMQYDNPQYRITFQGHSWYRNTANVQVNLNFPGANRFHVSGDIKAGQISLQYLPKVFFDLSEPDGEKHIEMWLEDRYVSSNIIPHDFLLDTHAPAATDNAQTTEFYYGDTGAWIRLSFNDNPEAIDRVSGIKRVFYKINDTQTKTIELKDSYGFPTAPELFAVTVNINKKSINNVLSYWSEDLAGNISSETVVSGIKVNSAPPQPISVIPVGGLTYEDEPGVYYINSARVTLNCFALNADRIWLAGDINENGTGPLGIPVNSYFNKIINLSGADGEKTVTISFGDELTPVGGIRVDKVIRLILDRVSPDVPTVLKPSSTPFYSNYKSVPFEVRRNGPEYATTYIYVNNIRQNNDPNSESTHGTLILGAPGVTTSFTIIARDKAGNTSSPIIMNGVFNRLGGLNILAGSLASEVNDIGVVTVNAQHERFVPANQVLKGVIKDPLLDVTVREFNAFDSAGQTLHDTNIYAEATMEIIIPLPEDLGELNPYDLRIFYFNEITAKWEEVQGEHKINMEEHTISVVVPHLSYYRVFAVIPFAANLGEVRVYPNPYRPDDNDPSTGDDSERFIRFENLTQTSKIKIFTISGELVNTLDEGKPQVEWKAENFDGENVASGIYIYLITDDDGNKALGRITIIRGE